MAAFHGNWAGDGDGGSRSREVSGVCDGSVMGVSAICLCLLSLRAALRLNSSLTVRMRAVYMWTSGCTPCCLASANTSMADSKSLTSLQASMSERYSDSPGVTPAAIMSLKSKNALTIVLARLHAPSTALYVTRLMWVDSRMRPKSSAARFSSLPVSMASKRVCSVAWSGACRCWIMRSNMSKARFNRRAWLNICMRGRVRLD
mmetsp:Transcript_17618/g.50036  ORF Transcript_17618/g.50036 Transcript_17618/m.50036 type:complete len:203 (-) Transcript_17618:754-1362(-)